MSQLSPWSSVFLAKLVFAQLVQKHSPFKELKDLLSYSQDHITGSYLKPDYSNPTFIPYFLNINFNIIFSTTSGCLNLASGPSPSCFPIEILYAFLVSLKELVYL
jgi:hypothetical protein